MHWGWILLLTFYLFHHVNKYRVLGQLPNRVSSPLNLVTLENSNSLWLQKDLKSTNLVELSPEHFKLLTEMNQLVLKIPFPKECQVACACPRLALRHMFSDTEALHCVLGTLPQREGGHCSSLVHYSQDWLFLLWFLEDFCSWEYPNNHFGW